MNCMPQGSGGWGGGQFKSQHWENGTRTCSCGLGKAHKNAHLPSCPQQKNATSLRFCHKGEKMGSFGALWQQEKYLKGLTVA